MIAHSFDEAFSLIQGLVSDFRQSEDYFRSLKYTEPRVREDFINKFWMALGWDVTHGEQKNPHEQEVTVEKTVNVEGRGKRADYAFSIAPHFRDARFFVEAKKPSGNIDNADDYFQTVRYGWNAHTPIAVLMDFEQFRILDCRYKPDIDSVLSYGALEKYHYSDFTNPEKFRRIYHLFSRAEVGNGSLEKYAEGLPKPSARTGQRALFVTGRFQSVDESFLQNLDTYREKLAHTFKSSNPQLESPELTEVTQRTLDRLVFMRFLEDKLIETDELVQKLVDSQRPWRDFIAISRKLNGIYNGIIFREHELLDAPDFKVDERTFTDICESLSHARSPYLFNYIPIHILGSIYERFLGKTIVVEGAEASVQDKPEVRKAGGVYYTPEYIVRYIVENTVGKLIEGKTPEEISRMNFADISCGSGSFLLGVYDLLLRYHRTYYNANKKRKAEGRRAGSVAMPDGTLQLSLKQKRDILTNNIYGVDIDAQAVEVAQLSLYLKLLEDETTASARLYQIELGDKLLPSLSKNIIGGNSLIDWDIDSGKLFDKHEERKLNPMSFKEEFPQIMKDGGFDAIVGNPPYGAQISVAAIDYLQSKFRTSAKDLDTYSLFMERAVQLTKSGGEISMIVPTGWYSGVKFSSLRRFIATATDPESFVNLPYDIFKAWVDTTVFTLKKRLKVTAWPRKESCEVQLRTFPKRHKIINESEFLEDLQTADFLAWFLGNTDEYLTYADSATTAIIRKIQKSSKPLAEFADVQRGVTPFVLTDTPHFPTSRRAFEGTVRRYTIEYGPTRYIRFDESLAEPKPERYFIGPRLLMRELISRQFQLQAVKVSEDFITNKSMQSILQREGALDLNYVLGSINSRLMSWYFLRRSNIAQRDDFPKIVLKETRLLPIPALDLKKKGGKAQHDKMVQLVEQMLDAKKQLAEAVTDRDKNLYERKCASIDRQIDELVYELYGLTQEEIELIEAG